MKITVQGAGAGGTAVAFVFAVHGHAVRLFDFAQFPDNIAAIASQGGIHAEGDIAGFGDIAYSGHGIDDALRDAEVVYVAGPAYSTEPFGEAVAGKLQDRQTVIVTPGSCGGALAFKRAVKKGTVYLIAKCTDKPNPVCFGIERTRNHCVLSTNTRFSTYYDTVSSSLPNLP